MDTHYPSSVVDQTRQPRNGPVPVTDPVASALWADYSPKSLGPKYPPHAMDVPIFGGLDIAGLLAATVMALGPLSAYAAGFGL